MWRKSLDSLITVLDCGDKCKWMCGISVGDDDRKCIILSVYIPYQNVDNTDDFICCLSDIEVLVDSCTSTSVFIMAIIIVTLNQMEFFLSTSKGLLMIIVLLVLTMS